MLLKVKFFQPIVSSILFWLFYLEVTLSYLEDSFLSPLHTRVSMTLEEENLMNIEMMRKSGDYSIPLTTILCEPLEKIKLVRY